ncbi:hypothetical protein TNCV_2350231 [Trichonephila clavipes]|uniref:Uncharacterized protein n=1 Tax=Trichonephila clavipes TaxID=2585209 RepID=A0A8X6SME3_TRICX|nr:hypothetical protein TNCV_2350231 [Trichonephila clavipes]
MGRTILLERRQSESVGRRNSRTTFLRSDWPRPFARREVGVEMDWVDPKINDPRQGDLEFKFQRSHAKIGGRKQTNGATGKGLVTKMSKLHRAQAERHRTIEKLSNSAKSRVIAYADGYYYSNLDKDGAGIYFIHPNGELASYRIPTGRQYRKFEKHCSSLSFTDAVALVRRKLTFRSVKKHYISELNCNRVILATKATTTYKTL